MIITTLNNSEKIAKKIAKELGAKYSKTQVTTFPDGDLYLKYNTELSKEKLIIVESFQPNPNKSLFDVIFAAKTAKDLGAKKVVLVVPYLAFMRQDKRFKDGESINAQIMSDLINNSGIDKIITVDPHLHRILKMKDVFTIAAKNVTANHLIAKFIKRKYRNVAVIGPDWESYQWADTISKEIGVEDTVFDKTRHSSRTVDVEVTKDIIIKGKNVVIVDDIISTGNTMVKACQKARKLGAKTVNAIGVHGLFVEKGYIKMKRAGFDDIVTCNTVEHETNKIDITEVLLEELRKELPKTK
ncbi:MAG: ribose-phosphate diphosphokinase [Candidatus Woesearchaeota archaeon]|jgi:ribose-phosphate pyrophosphokinase|nr:ribose-phosphate diphosphokinase [Candidatus Woesearchaeota archaeon]